MQVPPAMGHLKSLKELNLRYNNLDEKYRQKTEEGLSRSAASHHLLCAFNGAASGAEAARPRHE